MSFRLVPKSMTLNDLERRNGPYFSLFRRIREPYHQSINLLKYTHQTCMQGWITRKISQISMSQLGLRASGKLCPYR